MTQYTEDDVATANPIGTLGFGVAITTLANEVPDGDYVAQRFSRKGEAYVFGPMTSAEFLANLLSTAAFTSVNSAASSTTILASNANRRGAIVVNTDANALYLDLTGGTAATTRYARKLAEGETCEIPFGLTGPITGLWADDGSGAALVTEFTAAPLVPVTLTAPILADKPSGWATGDNPPSWLSEYTVDPLLDNDRYWVRARWRIDSGSWTSEEEAQLSDIILFGGEYEWPLLAAAVTAGDLDAGGLFEVQEQIILDLGEVGEMESAWSNIWDDELDLILSFIPDVVVAEGDSITSHAGSYANQYDALNPELDWNTLAVGGSGIETVVARKDDALALRPEVLSLLIGANDLQDTTTYPDVQDYYDAVVAYTNEFKETCGTKIAICTVLPVGDPNGGNKAVHNARREDLNELFRDGLGTDFDAVVDFDTTIMGATDAVAEDTDYYDDGVHPGDDGRPLMLPPYSEVINELLGILPPVATIWDIANKHAFVDLDMGSLRVSEDTVIGDVGGPIGVTSTTTRDFGKVMFEVTLNGIDPGDASGGIYVGVSNYQYPPAPDVPRPGWYDALGFLWRSQDGVAFHNAGIYADFTTQPDNDSVVGILLNFDVNQVYVIVDGVVQEGDPDAGTGGRSISGLGPMYAFAAVSTSDNLALANFGASTFAYPYSGYTGWDE